MSKKLGFFSVLMVTVLLAVPASAITTADSVTAMMATDATFDAFRIVMYENHGYGMSRQSGTTTGGDIMNNSVIGAGYLPMSVLPLLNPNITAADLAQINANFAALPAQDPRMPTGFTAEWSTLGQLYGSRMTQPVGYSTPQWDVVADVLGQNSADGLACCIAGHWMQKLNDFAVYNPLINPTSLAALNAGFAALAVPAPSTLFLLGSALIGLAGIERYRKR